MPDTPVVIDARYEILAPLGQGGMGAVHRARDRENGRQVALKTVDRADLGPWSVDALRHEFRVLSGLHHPNLVEVYDFGAMPAKAPGGSPTVYFTEELIDGRDLNGHCRGRLPEGWLPAIVQVCRALEFLHSRGYVHGDVKPTNILVLPSDLVKVVDLGLASEHRARGTSELRGTLAYLAPECFRGGAIDGRTDLYALGVMLYDLAVGHAPFAAQSPRDWMKRHCTDPPPPFPPGHAAPPFLERLIFRLLEKDPRARYFTANDVIEAINRGLGTKHPAETAATIEGRIFSVDWVGRREVLSGLIETLARVQDPAVARASAELLLLQGEPGMGKSRCLRELAYRAQLDGLACLRIGFRGLEHHPEQPLRALCRLLARQLPEDAERRPAWARGYEDFLATLGPAGVAGAEAVDPERARQYMARLAAEACATTPIVLLLDDLDQAPETALKDVLALLASAQRLEASPRLLACATMGGAGPEPLAPAPVDTKLLHSLMTSPGARVIPLPPLSEEETLQLGAGVLGLERVPASFAAWLQRSTGGVPFWIEENLRALVARGRLHVGEAFDRFEPPSEIARVEGADAAAASRAAALLDEQARMLTEDERGLAESLAVLGRPAPRAFLQTVSEWPVGRMLAALQRLLTRTVLRVERDEESGGGGESLWFSRGALGRFLYGRLPAARRAELHARVAAAGGGESVALPRSEAALHLALAGARDREAAFWTSAAAEARASGNSPAAERILRHLLSQRERADHTDAYPPLAHFLIAHARFDEADALGTEMGERAGGLAGAAGEFLRALGLETRAAVRARRGDIAGARGMFAEAHALWSRLADAGDARSADARMRVAPSLAASYGETGQGAEAARVIELHMALDPPPEVRSQFHYLRGTMLRRDADPEGAEAEMRHALEAAQRVANPLLRESTTAAARYGIGHDLSHKGEHEAALREMTGAYEAFHRLGHTHSEITLLREMANLHLHLGRARAALEHVRRSLRLAEPMGNAVSLGMGLALRGVIHHQLGDWPEAEEDLVAAVRQLEKAGARAQLADALMYLGNFLNQSTRFAEALEPATRAVKLIVELQERPSEAAARMQELRALRGLGAEARVREELAVLRADLAPELAARADLLEFHLALEVGDLATAQARLESARRQLGAGVGLRERLELQLAAVRVSLETGQVAEARKELDALRAEAGELELGRRGEILELEARLQARSHRTQAALTTWQEAARFWERRKAPLRLALALSEAGVQAQALGDRTLARAYFQRAVALWRVQEEGVPEWARELFRGRADYLRARARLEEAGTRVEVDVPASDPVVVEDKTVVLEADPAPTHVEQEAGDPEKDLLRAVILVLRERSPEELRRRLVEKSMECFGASRGALFLDAHFLHASAEGLAMPVSCAGVKLLPAEVRPTEPAAEGRRLIDHLKEWMRIPATERRLRAGELLFLDAAGQHAENAPSRGKASGVLVPLPGATGKPLGILYLEWGGGESDADGRNIELLPLFSSHAAAALESAMHASELATDPATDLPTPAACRIALRLALDRAHKGRWPFVLVLAGLRDLDAIRQRHGLPEGDRWLRKIAGTLSELAAGGAKDAWVGRGEGDEFLIALPAIDAARAAAWVREAMGRIARESLDGSLKGVPPTVSLVLAVYPDEADEPEMLWFKARRRLREMEV